MFGFIGGIASVAALFLASIAWARNPFEMGKVDYFNEASLSKAVHKEQKELDWREPVIDQSGKISYYTPPGPVLALLENPTEDNAKAYLEWQNAKALQMQKAQEVLLRLLEKKP